MAVCIRTWYGGRPQPRPHCVRWGFSFPSPKGAEPANFQPMSVVIKRLDGLRCHLVWSLASAQSTLCWMGTQLPQKKKQFLAHLYCCQTAGLMKTPLGTEVDLGPGHNVLDENPAPPRNEHSSPLFLAHVYCSYGHPSQLLLSSCFFLLLAVFLRNSRGEFSWNFNKGFIGTGNNH